MKFIVAIVFLSGILFIGACCSKTVDRSPAIVQEYEHDKSK